MKHLKHLKLLFTALLLLYSAGATAYTYYAAWYGVRYNCENVSGSYRASVTGVYPSEISAIVVLPLSVSFDGLSGSYPLEVIGGRSFQEATNLKTLVIQSSVKAIGGSAFGVSLKKLMLPASLTSLNTKTQSNGYTFNGCEPDIVYNASGLDLSLYGLSSKTVVLSVPSYSKDGDYLWATENGVHKLIAYIGDATTVVLPDKYQGTDYVINDYAFYGCDVVDVTIPASVTAIGNNAFQNCRALKNIAIPSSVRNIPSYAFDGCSSLTNVELPSTIKSIGNYAFRGCSSLAYIEIPESVTTIGNYAFQGCSSVSNLEIPGSVTSIGTYAFAYCTKLSNIVVPQGIATVGSYVFSGCTSLASISEVGSFGNYMFNGCTALKTVSIPNGVTGIANYTFNGCTALQNVEIPSTVTSIGDGAFYGCTNIANIEIPTSVKSVGASAFQNCTALKGITLPTSVTTIGNNAFSGCTAITYVSLPATVTSLGSYAFSGCTALQSIELPTGFKTISTGCFSGCSSLVVVTIPSSLTSIGSSAFDGCNLKKTIFLGNTAPTNYKAAKAEYSYVASADKYSEIPEVNRVVRDYLSSSFMVDGVRYVILSPAQRTAEVIGCDYHTAGLNVVVGNKVTYNTIELSVKDIAPYSFYANANVSTVSVSNDGNIGVYAFNNCKNITSINIANTGNIESYAFAENNIAVSDVVIANGGNVGSYAFKNSKLRNLQATNGGYIGSYAFEGVTNIEKASLANQSYIGNSAFRYSQIADLEISCKGDIKNSAFKQITGNQKTVIANTGIIADSAFIRSSIGNLEIASTVGNIGHSAFLGMSNNSQTRISNNGYISERAFYGSKIGNLTVANAGDINSYSFNSSTIGDLTVTNTGNIGTYAFAGIKNTAKAVISNAGVISDYAFQNSGIGDATIGCTGNIGTSAFNGSTVASVAWGETFAATSIGNSAFAGCASLAAIEIPNGVTALGSSAFSGCTSMKSAVVGTGITALNTSTFQDCSSLQSITVGENVTTIGEACFSGCRALPQITIPAKTTTIGNNVFNSCSSLSRVIINDNVNGKIKLGNGGTNRAIFADCPLDTVYAGAKLLYTKTQAAGYSPFHGNTKLRAIEFAQAEDSIHNKEFMNCTNLRSVYVGKSVKNIGTEAFYNCSKLQNLVPASKITVAENGSKIVPTGVYVDNTVTNLGAYAFYGCSSIKKAVVGDNIPAINSYTFNGCTALNDVKLGAKVKSIDTYAFNNCRSLPEIVIPAANDKIGNYAFDGCTSLADVIINDSENTLTIGSCGSSPMFADSPLDSLYIGRKVRYTATESVGYSPFYNNKSLRTVTVGDLETQIYNYEFYNCSGLTDVVIGDGVTDIKLWAFSGCVGLTNFMCGESVATIGDEAFSDCTSMVKFVSESETPPVCGNQALADINIFNCTLYVPAASINAYQASDQWNGFFFVQGTEKTYTLKYVIDGEVYATYSLVEGAATIQPETPVREGYTFDGWSEIPATMPAGDVTITGSFSVTTYTLKYVIDDEVYATYTLVPGAVVEVPEAPVRDGYTFSGWGEIPETMPASDVTITGSFTLITYTLKYVIDNVVYATYTLAPGATIMLPEAPVRDGYTFSGWGEIPETMPANDVTITGSFTLITYTLSYVIDNVVYATYTLAPGAVVEVPETPVRDGYTFSGWSEIPETMPANNVTVTGSFVVNNYSITYRVDGNVYATDDVTAGANITLVDAPAKAGYTFLGWAYDLAPAIDIKNNADAMLYTNAPCTNTQYGDQFVGWHVLFDNDPATFFHSEYSDVESADGLDHYLRVDMGNNPISLFTFAYSNRQNNTKNAPAIIVVEGSNSANGEYDEIATITGLTGENYTSDRLGNGNAYRYIRFRVLETETNQMVKEHPYFSISEFAMTDIAAPAVMPNADVVLTAVYVKNNDTFQADGFYYKITDTAAHTVEITHNNGENTPDGTQYAGCVTIPENVTYDGVTYNVTAIGENAFYGCTSLEGVVIPENILTIGNGAFYNCTSLTGVVAQSATPATVGENAFYGVAGSNVMFSVPAGAKAAYEAATGWNVLENIVEKVDVALPLLVKQEDGLPGIDNGNNLVWESDMLSFETVQNGIRITILETGEGDSYNGYPMVALGELEFYDIMGNKLAYESVTTNSLESTEGSLDALYDGNYATYYHSTWSNGTVPNAPVYIDVVFSKAVKAVFVRMVSRDNKRLMPTSIGITGTGVACMPEPYGTCGENANWSFDNGVLTISGSGDVTSKGWSAYAGEITSVVIEDGITAMPGESFLRYTSLTTATLPSSLTAISDGMFSRTGLVSIEIPEGVTSLGTWSFDNCPSLATVTLPTTLTSLSDRAFENCGSLESITVAGETPATVGTNAFAGISGTATLYVPKGTKATYEAAEGWNTIPNIVELIEEYQITYIVDGEVYATVMVEVGTDIVPVEAPEKELYAFIEWSGMPEVMPAQNIEVEAVYEQVAVSFTMGKYGTTVYSSEFALDFSEVGDLKAYAATGYNTETGEITMTRTKTTNAGVGIYLTGTPNATYIIPIIDYSHNHSLNMLVGVLEKTTVYATSGDGLYANYRYVTKTGDTSPKFYQSAAGGASVSAGKAYLQIPLAWLGGNASKAIKIRFDEGEIINDNEEAVEEVIYYDLQGRRVENPSNGIYIVNGKKVWVK